MPSDLTLNPDFPLDIKPVYSTIITKFDNGIVQRRPRRSAAIREFTLSYQNRSVADMQTILDLFDACKGSGIPFTWDNPEDSQTYTVAFKDDQILRTYKAYGIYDFKFTLVQQL